MTENKKKWTVVLKEALALFGLEKSGSREDLIDRLLTYLFHPKELKVDASGGGQNPIEEEEIK